MNRIRVAVTYRVCQNWRLPIFRRLSENPLIELRVFHGQDIPGTKLINAEDFNDLDHKELKSYYLKLKSSGRQAYALIYPSILDQLNKYKPQVVLCEGGSNIFNNLLVYWWARRNSASTIWWCLGGIPGRKYHGFSRLYQWLRKRLMNQSTVLLGYSSRAIQCFEQEGFTQPMFRAVNTVDTDKIFEDIKRVASIQPSLRDRFKIKGHKAILYVGAVEPPKRLDILLHAYKQIKAAQTDSCLIVVGDGSSLPHIRKLAQELGLQDIHFAGRVIENISEYFLAADIFVLPGLGGLAISEAMAHGLPIVCTVADGCEVDLVQKQNGLIVVEDNIESLARGIESILSDREKCLKMGIHSRRIIDNEHNIHTYNREIVNAIMCAYEIGTSIIKEKGDLKNSSR